MSEIMHKYQLTAPFQNKDAGFSRWTFGISEGREYFLKEFLDPVYPDDSSLSVKLRQERIEDCKEYEIEKMNLYEAINRVSDGNLIRIKEFFRYDSHYYIAMDKVNAHGISVEELQAYPFEDRLLLCKTVAHSIMKLHEAHIVHSDLKISNVLIKRTAYGKLVGKIIDMDSSFFEAYPPLSESDLVADQVYMAPESCQFLCGEDVRLSCKIDVFALGILFHQYLTGTLPSFDQEEYDYIFDAVLDGQKLQLSPMLNEYYRTLIYGMLECDPEKRYSMAKVFAILRELDPNDHPEEETDPEPMVNSKADKYGFMRAGDL